MSSTPELKPPPPDQGTPFAEASALLAQGKSPAEIFEALKAKGVDAESARVVVNSLPGAVMPQALPEATFSMPTNPLAPQTVALSDLGMSGDAKTVGTYWVAFGVVLCVMSALAMWANDAKLISEGHKLADVFSAAGLIAGSLAVVVGLTRIVRRR